MTKNVRHPSHRDILITLDGALSDRIFEASASPPGPGVPNWCPEGINTPQKSHSESLRSSFDGQIFEVRKNLGGAHRRSLVCAARCGHFVVKRWYLSSSGVPMVQCRCRGQSELSQVQASASETQMERRYDPKRAAKTTSACESACAKARESRAGKISA